MSGWKVYLSNGIGITTKVFTSSEKLRMFIETQCKFHATDIPLDDLISKAVIYGLFNAPEREWAIIKIAAMQD